MNVIHIDELLVRGVPGHRLLGRRTVSSSDNPLYLLSKYFFLNISYYYIQAYKYILYI